MHERIDHVMREAVRIRRHRLGRHDAHQLPVAGGRVLSLRTLPQAAGDRRRARLRRASEQRLDVAETESFEIRKVQSADRARDVSQRVRTFIAVVGGIRKLARADGVEHDYARSRHAAILGRR